MRTRSFLPAALLLCGCSLRHRPVAPEPVRGPARDSLFQLDRARSDTVAARGAVNGMLSLFATDVVYLRAGAPAVYGLAATRIVMNAAPVLQSGLVSWEPLGGGVSNDLRSGYTYGVTARAGLPETPGIHLERYIAYWERGAGRPWRIVAYAEVGSSPLANGDIGLSMAQTTPPAQTLPKLLEEARLNVWAADSMFSDLSYRMGAGYAFSSTITDDGVLFGTPELLIGPKAVREAYEARGETSSLTWKPVFANVAGSRDLGYTIGESISTGRGPSGSAVQRFGKYLTVWKKQKDGTWRVAVDGGNAR